ncbi:patched domain-containing protein 3-like [Ptychodera flava]|uniref:patched domain-containing protein 3-like n=1 Tax=Ptychodera flava TaxID=63121 RepID=UPI00396A2E13
MASECQFDWLERRLSSLFYRLGKFIGRHPLPFLTVSMIAAGVFGSGMVFFYEDNDLEYLYTPENSQAAKDRDMAERLFPLKDGEFHPVRQTREGRYGRLIFAATDDGDVLRENTMREILEVDQSVRGIGVTFDDEKYIFDDLCGKWDGRCYHNAILQLYNDDGTRINNNSFTYPVYSADGLLPVFLGGSLGGAEFYEDQETVKSATVLHLVYHLKYGSRDDDAKSRAWEREFLDVMSQYESENIEIAYLVSQTQELELEGTVSVIPLFSITFTVLITFSVLCCIMADWVRSKPWLGILGVLSAGLAILSALGLCSYCGLPFVNLVAAMPFLILGIGVDDMFIMIAGWRRTSPSLSVEERMGHAYSEAAMSITITSLTDVIAFGIGVTSFFPSVRIFCIYTGIAVLFDYLYQITFFGACMALMGEREAANRHIIICRTVLPKEEAPSTAYRILCAGGSSAQTPPKEDENHLMTRFFKQYYGPFITSILMKILVVALFAGFFGVAVWGCLQVEEGIRLENFAKDDSYAVRFYNLQDEYFREYGPAVAITINDEISYSDSGVQEAIDGVIAEFERSDFFRGANYTQSWLRDFLSTGPTYIRKLMRLSSFKAYRTRF